MVQAIRVKTVLRNVRYPRQWNPGKSLSICDDNGIVVATVYWSIRGIHIDHLAGFDVLAHEMNGLGQYNFDNEPDKPWNCPHCQENPEAWDIAKEKVVCKICGGAYIEG